jgi:ferredoxin
MRVWIDQDLCTGDGLCVDHCPDVFVQLEDGIAYVAEGGSVLNDPGGSGSLATVSLRNLESVIRSAEVCPGECIFIEIDAPVDAELDLRVDSRIASRIEICDDEAAA